MRALALGVLLAATTARADSAALGQELGGADDGRAGEAAAKLGQSADPKAVDALLEALGNGPPPKVAAAALKALGGKKDVRVVPALVEWAHHRTPEVRKAALAALATSPAAPGQSDKRAMAALVAALGDSDAEVRAAAARGVGDRRERSAETRLIKLMEHRDASAATALAAIATPELAHRLSEMLGQ